MREPSLGDWWRGTWLVAQRTVRENIRTRSFKVLTVFLLLLTTAAITVPQLNNDGHPTYELATVGDVPADLREGLDAAGARGDFEVDYVAVDDDASLRAAVREGSATAGLAEERIYTSMSSESTFAAVVGQTVVGLESARVMAEAGLTAAQMEQLGSIRPPQQVAVESDQEQARQGVAFAAVILLYLAITFAGTVIGTQVAVEKSSRISEVLLAVLRPSQTLVGTVLGVGSIALLQLLVVTVPLAVAVRLTDDIGLPAVAAGDLSLAVAWFVAGFLLYGFLFAATASMVDKITEVSTAMFPVTGTLVVVYLVALLVVQSDPRSAWSMVASLFPLSAPIAMPIRWATGDVPAYQLGLAFLLTAAAAVLVVRLAALVYERALVVTGRRLGLRQAWSLLRRPG